VRALRENGSSNALEGGLGVMQGGGGEERGRGEGGRGGGKGREGMGRRGANHLARVAQSATPTPGNIWEEARRCRNNQNKQNKRVGTCPVVLRGPFHVMLESSYDSLTVFDPLAT